MAKKRPDNPRNTKKPETIKIALPFEKAIEGLLSVKPKKRPAKKKRSE